MQKYSFVSIVWGFAFGAAAVLYFMSHLTLSDLAAGFSREAFALHKESAPVWAVLSAFLSIFGLTAALERPEGRFMTLASIASGGMLLFAAMPAESLGLSPGSVHHLSQGAALLLLFRLASIVLLPPMTVQGGPVEVMQSLSLACAACLIWLFLDPANMALAVSAALVLSWPTQLDGINRLADRVFHRAALAGGARRLHKDCLSLLAGSSDLVIEKQAVLSGPSLTVTNVMAFDNEPKTLLAVAASAEKGSDHATALALRDLAAQWKLELKIPDRFTQVPGLGVTALLGGQTVTVGTTDLLKSQGIDSFTADAIARSLEADGKTVLRVAVGGRVTGVLGLEGSLRQDAGVAGFVIRAEGLMPWLFSGDSAKTRTALAGMLGIQPVEGPKTAETVLDYVARAFEPGSALVLKLSHDRTELELWQPGTSEESSPKAKKLAVSSTADIGAFSALKALATRRAVLARQARRVISGIWLAAGIGGALGLIPVHAAPVVFALTVLVLFLFAKLHAEGGHVRQLSNRRFSRTYSSPAE